MNSNYAEATMQLRLISVIFLLLIVAMACNIGATVDVSAAVASTQTAVAARTIAAPPTVAPTQSTTLTAVKTTQTPLTPTALVTSTATCQDKVGTVKDVTYPDGDQVQAGKSFVKTWRLKNAGTCTWTPKYTLVFLGKERMDGNTPIPLKSSVPPGGEVEVSVQLTAPKAPGTYRSEWLLHNAADKPFGWGQTANEPFWVEIITVGAGTPVSTATKGPSEIKASLVVDQAAYTGHCPATLNFSATVEMDAPGKVDVIFEAGANAGYGFDLPGVTSRTLTKAGTITLPYYLTMNGSVDGWAVLRVLSPIETTSNIINFTVVCQ
ncbi:MAG: NBR1-Ig-like domain-containing protein [Anaerolineales bacterium]|nr:NBR1-Ig-like domain-containing protein [Anaerolineales bacterium]